MLDLILFRLKVKACLIGLGEAEIKKTKNGCVIFDGSSVYKFYNRSVFESVAHSNIKSFEAAVNSILLNKPIYCYCPSGVMVSKERLLNSTVKLSPTGAVQFYVDFIGEKYNFDHINKEEYIAVNYPCLRRDMESNLKRILDRFNVKVAAGLVHGDFWHENVLFDEKESLHKFIDYDRSSKYGIFLIDIINYFVMYYLTFVSRMHSWDGYVDLLDKVILQKGPYFDLKKLMVIFSSKIKCDFDDRSINGLLMLYLFHTIYVNDFYLKGLDSLRWRRHRKKLIGLMSCYL